MGRVHVLCSWLPFFFLGGSEVTLTNMSESFYKKKNVWGSHTICIGESCYVYDVRFITDVNESCATKKQMRESRHIYRRVMLCVWCEMCRRCEWVMCYGKKKGNHIIYIGKSCYVYDVRFITDVNESCATKKKVRESRHIYRRVMLCVWCEMCRRCVPVLRLWGGYGQ